MKTIIIVAVLFTICLSQCSAQTPSTSEMEKQIHKEALASEEYREAFMALTKNKSTLALATKNKISKSEALAYYNQTLGLRMGSAKTFVGAYKIVEAKGGAYLKYVLYNKMSDIAFRNAAEKHSEAEQLKLK